MSKRPFVIYVVAALAVIGLLVRYSYVMVFAPKDVVRQKSYRVERGPILDRNGNVLAIQTRLFRVSAWKPSFKGKDPENVIKKLAEVLEMKEDEIREKFNRKGNAVQIARKVSFEKNEKLRKLISTGELPGVRLDPDFGRSYPEKELASHLIGFAGDDNTGLSGIEQRMNKFLNPGGDAEAYSDVVYGNQVFLTIDTNIQNFAQQASMEIMEQHKPLDGLVTLVADAKTGEILAYVSMPEIDLNNYSKYRPDDPIMMNKPVSYLYEPGSVFKVFSISSFLDLGGITPETKFTCTGENCYKLVLRRGRIFTIRCTGTHKTIDTGDIIKYSCNTACYASDTASKEDFYNMVKKFGFGQVTGVEMNGEAAGFVSHYKDWYETTKPTMAIGQAISVNAMQIIQAATAVANHGTMLAPRVVKKVTDATGKLLFETERREIGQVIDPKVADDMLLMMERASINGTARRHGVKGVRLSCKTGTAQVAEKKGYSDTKFTASCLCIFPTENPQYIIYNATFSPTGSITTGAGISVPAIGKIANNIVAYKGIPREGDTLAQFDGNFSAERNDKDFTVFDTIPDFTGASKKHLLPLFKDGRFNLTIKGDGWVYKQNPEPGTPVTSGMTLEFELR